MSAIKTTDYQELLRLSEVEFRVLKLLAEGKTTKEAAFEVKRSIKTIESHSAHIKSKLGITHMSQLRVYAARAIDFMEANNIKRSPVSIPKRPKFEFIKA